ncbi:MAG: hypothetical protein H6649_00280 [Caldilineae bacterium]|nr:hypothetical protein [Anaerolineae bacterium]MCB0199902.1 hypothetical protein [Anaerolineae bacterium]MCB0203475.1 hypothetical protein [Anaerolineae bacterium]MCB0253851.1 hypothetical protein [Anaerolineae bacterium]MCB9152478.1 hypothetical protein [Caldilineae bacterium]
MLAAIILTLSLLLSPVQQQPNPPWYMSTPLPARGEVTFYAYDVMERAYHRRLELAQVPYCDKPACVGYIATLRPGDLGRKVWLVRPGLPAEGPFLVVDYAAARDFDRLNQRGVVAEVDYETARRWGMSGPLYNVTMLSESPMTERMYLPMVPIGRPASTLPAPATQRQ